MKNSLLFKYMKPHIGRLLFNVFLRTLSALFTIVLIVSVAPLLYILFDTGNAGAGAQATEGLANAGIEVLENWVNLSIARFGKPITLLILAGCLTGAYFLKNLCAYMGLYLFSPIRNRMVAQMRNDMFKKYMTLPLSYYSQQQKGDLISRITDNTQEVDNQMLNQIQEVLVDIITFIFLVAALFFISVPLSLFVLVILPVIGVVTSFISRSLKRKSRQLQDLKGHIAAQVSESLDGMKTIRSYNTTPYAVNKFRKDNDSFYRLNSNVLHRTNLSSPVSEVLGTIAIVVILVVGGYLILSQHSLRPEAFITYLLAMIQILPSSKNITTAYFVWQSGKGSLARIQEVFEAEEVIVQKENATELKTFEHEIALQDVCFTYGEKQTLKHIDLRIEKGKFVALVGPSGGGKSTVINLIPRFYDPVSGRITIDGNDLADCRIDDLRELSSLVSQDTVLFNDTLYNNILVGNPKASKEEVEHAAKMADAHGFIMQSENGYQSLIGDSGTKLSGGQRQRISIARALLKKAPILLFDEATSALDTEAENRIMEAIRQEGKKNRQTIISVAHRLSSIRQADEIIVIEEGRIVERGTHEQLYAQQGLYHKLCQMQNTANQ
ncbi:MAG: ABC transporter ATP-binding protein/permease [Bacteroides sp.]|nr:ABC transporter ATP-binding protein/permease [Ruminococcus flavefaciens]MCM1555243.1 ABC transporter ATP-binding protein/permease [Bacteroides sp.]